MKLLFQVIISILLEPEVHQLPDGAQLVRALNVLTVKMIDRSDPTAITCAFIRQLRESVGNTGVSQDFTEMVSSQELIFLVELLQVLSSLCTETHLARHTNKTSLFCFVLFRSPLTWGHQLMFRKASNATALVWEALFVSWWFYLAV